MLPFHSYDAKQLYDKLSKILKIVIAIHVLSKIDW